MNLQFGHFRFLAAAFFLVSMTCLLLLSFERPRRVILSASDIIGLSDFSHDESEEQDWGNNVDWTSPGQGGSHSSLTSCPPLDSQTARRLSASSYEYARAVFRPRISANTPHNRLTAIEQPVLSQFVQDVKVLNDAPCSIIDVDVEPDPVGTEDVESKILTGYASSVDRLKRFAPTIKQTLGKYSSAVAILGPESESKLSTHKSSLRRLGLNIVDLYTSDLAFTSKYFSLVNVFANYTASHDWFFFLDDDSYLPRSISLIASRLSKLDPHEPHFIGVPSDSGLQISHHGGWAHGGGGIIISAATITHLSSHFSECQAEYDAQVPVGGDHRLFLCAEIAERYLPEYNITGRGVLSNYTVWPELKQWDLAGGAEGIFEAGLDIWTFHHWDSTGWFDSPRHAAQSGLATLNSGIKSLLRRFIFDDTNPPPSMTSISISTNDPPSKPSETNTTIPAVRSTSDSDDVRTFYLLTNAYSLLYIHIPSISALSSAYPPKHYESTLFNMSKVEYTWLDDSKWFIDSQGESRPRLSELTERGLVEARRYRLDETMMGEFGEVKQWFIWDQGSSTDPEIEEGEEPEESSPKTASSNGSQNNENIGDIEQDETEDEDEDNKDAASGGDSSSAQPSSYGHGTPVWDGESEDDYDPTKKIRRSRKRGADGGDSNTQRFIEVIWLEPVFV